MSDFDVVLIVQSNRIVTSKDTWRRAESQQFLLVCEECRSDPLNPRN